MEKSLDALLEELGHIHPDFKRIPADMVEVGDWVRWEYYKAFAMGALPCSYCKDCLPERAGFVLDQASKRFCEHPHKVRPSMEACGIDAFKTVRNAGYEVEVLTSPHEKITFFGLLLLE